MDHSDVTLVGVFDPEGKHESFTYTVDAPTNLWIGALCSDGSRMSTEFQAHFLNELLEADAFNEGDFVITRNQNGVCLVAIVGDEVRAREVEAFLAHTDTVKRVTVNVGG
jgi:hypothetical protein